MGLNTLFLAHKFVSEHVKPGDFCIDATAGKGRDTAFLCDLVKETGKVLAFDIQPDAIRQTQALISEKGYDQMATAILDSHSNMEQYAEPETVDCIMFNFGWLPGGDHDTFSTSKTSLIALEKALELLKPGGVMSLCLYYGKENGTEERDAILDLVKGWDQKRCSVLLCDFINRASCPPIAVLIEKDR